MLPSLPVAFSLVLARAGREIDQFCADRLRDGFQLDFAKMRFENLEVGALHADNRIARATVAGTDLAALAHKYLGHAVLLSENAILGVCP
jgi:hypothetical protein